MWNRNKKKFLGSNNRINRIHIIQVTRMEKSRFSKPDSNFFGILKENFSMFIYKKNHSPYNRTLCIFVVIDVYVYDHHHHHYHHVIVWHSCREIYKCFFFLFVRSQENLNPDFHYYRQQTIQWLFVYVFLFWYVSICLNSFFFSKKNVSLFIFRRPPMCFKQTKQTDKKLPLFLFFALFYCYSRPVNNKKKS